MLSVHISRALEDQHLQEDVITDGVDEDEKKMRVTAKEIVNEAGTAEYAKAQPVVHTVLGELPTAPAPALAPAPAPAQLWMGCVSAELNSVFNKSFQRRIGGSSFSKTGQISELKGIVNEFSGKLKEFIEKDIGDWQVWDQV